ncbi:uncharacterized protein L969DRAFT_216265 [Mixia osmundae IAM 14324]|uniref:uncharacterized protein n=1 Tax=Mixia osmundae (strain CBS 9802 / IAM 14324 / JCM 22182 / KY 12970) TaxID=764103 RepID=UPI0004A552EA|nr:uncharacterized protein L969DRAFT_216265 [Mixia osmundae IAM 14324]KEI37134.1 hypothetical protein L969DRAFT_216265 [Mixia osmundae IAM 14324]
MRSCRKCMSLAMTAPLSACVKLSQRLIGDRSRHVRSSYYPIAVVSAGPFCVSKMLDMLSKLLITLLVILRPLATASPFVSLSRSELTSPIGAVIRRQTLEPEWMCELTVAKQYRPRALALSAGRRSDVARLRRLWHMMNMNAQAITSSVSLRLSSFAYADDHAVLASVAQGSSLDLIATGRALLIESVLHLCILPNALLLGRFKACCRHGT